MQTDHRVVATPLLCVSDVQGAAWVAKGCDRAAGLLPLAGAVADPAPVSCRLVPADAKRRFGDFMIAWPEPDPAGRCVAHLGDVSFFRAILQSVFTPILASGTIDSRILRNSSRIEMALTNDALQIQLHGLPDGTYSMIRHHALMLFLATLWLDEPDRGAWLGLYEATLGYLDSEGGRPSLGEIVEIERTAFEDFERYAVQSTDPAGAADLLASRATLEAVVQYHRCAAAAVGLLSRQYRDLSVEQRAYWVHHQLSQGYADPAYLKESWSTES